MKYQGRTREAQKKQKLYERNRISRNTKYKRAISSTKMFWKTKNIFVLESTKEAGYKSRRFYVDGNAVKSRKKAKIRKQRLVSAGMKALVWKQRIGWSKEYKRNENVQKRIRIEYI